MIVFGDAGSVLVDADDGRTAASFEFCAPGAMGLGRDIDMASLVQA